jgi:hypothetical protein
MCKSVPAQSQIWHTMWQSCLKWRTISHMYSIFYFTCVKYDSPFFWHMVCQIRLKWSQQRIIVKQILHNMCQMWLCAGARFTVHLRNFLRHTVTHLKKKSFITMAYDASLKVVKIEHFMWNFTKILNLFSLGWQPGFYRAGTCQWQVLYHAHCTMHMQAMNDRANPIHFKFKI